jgi:tight adherence protein C
MDWITNTSGWLNTVLGDPELLRLGYSALLGASVFILALALYFLATGVWNPLRRRVDSVKDADPQPPARRAGRRTVASLGDLLVPKLDAKRLRLEELLRHAGFRSEGALRELYGIKLVATVLGPALLLLASAITHALPTVNAVLYSPLVATLGFVLPDIVLARLARRRQERLRRSLPDAMDLLVVCSEAGLGLGAGIQRVAGEIALTHPELSDELGLFSMQTRAGMDSRAALKDLEARTGLEDIQALVAMLLQSMRFGTSIADTLRIYAEELRDKRLQRAQEKAARIGTVMAFPLILCLMPSFMLVILGPPMLGAINALSSSGMLGN